MGKITFRQILGGLFAAAVLASCSQATEPTQINPTQAQEEQPAAPQPTAREKQALTTSDCVGVWQGKTDQGFPMTLWVEDQDGTAIVTQVQFAIEMYARDFKVKQTLEMPRPITARVVEGAFQYASEQPASGSLELTGEFHSPSELSGTLMATNVHPQGLGTAVGQVGYELTRR